MKTYSYECALRPDLKSLENAINENLPDTGYKYSIWEKKYFKLFIEFENELTAGQETILNNIFNNLEKSECIY